MAQKKKNNFIVKQLFGERIPSCMGTPKNVVPNISCMGKWDLKNSASKDAVRSEGCLGYNTEPPLAEKSLPSATGTGQFHPNHCHRSV